MELTRSYQEVAWAYLGSSAGDLYVRAYAMYTAQDIANNRSYVYYKATAYFTGSYIYDQNGNGSIGGTGVNTRSGAVTNVTGEVTIAETEGWVTHDADGTKSINVVAKLNFPNWDWYATATGSATLPSLHKPPEISNVFLQELNTDVSDAGVPGYHIVQYLSEKQFTANVTYYDDATISSLKIYHNNVLIGTSSTNQVTVNFANVGVLSTYQPGDYLMVPITFEIIDSLNGKVTYTYYYRIVQYTLPTYDNTTTLIKRKTGNGTVLTDNIALLNFTGTCYLENDAIGNHNDATIKYKIWNTESSEPANYTDITSSATITDNNVVISNYQLSNLAFTNAYNYKIKISDEFGNEIEKIGVLATGVAVWTEYKDHVDFLELTVKNNNPFEYSTSEEIIVGKWIDGSDIYRNTLEIPVSSSTTNANVSSLNIGFITRYYGTALTNSNSEIKPFPYHNQNDNENYAVTYIKNTGNLKIACNSSYLYGTVYLTIEYIKSS